MKNRKTTMALAICLVMLLGALSLEHTLASSESSQQMANPLESVTINENTIDTGNNPLSTFPYESWSNYSFPGDGSATHPYIIEGTLDCSSNRWSAINILNTNAYFILKVAYPSNTPFSASCQVNLNNVTHGQIQGSTIIDQDTNIYLSTVKIQNTEFKDSSLWILRSNNSILEGNKFHGYMYVIGSNNNTIADNTFNGTKFGIYMNHSNDNILKNNTFTNVNYTIEDYSGTNNVIITKIATTSKKTPGLTFELLMLALISIVVVRKKRNT